LRLRALSGGDSQSAPIPRRAAKATLEEAAEVAEGGIAQLLGDSLGMGKLPLSSSCGRHISGARTIIDKIRRTAGQLALNTALEGTFVAVKSGR